MEATIKNGLISPRRLGHLILRELAGGYRSVLIAMAAVAGVIIISSILSLFGLSQVTRGTGADGSFYFSYFMNLLFIGGFIITSLAFKEVWQNGGGIFYLTLPGSTLEKLLSKLLVTSVGYALGSMVFMAAVTAASEGINMLLFGYGHGMPDLGGQLVGALKAVLFYVITQSVFLLGSIWFRKTALVRTALWIMIFGVAAVIVAFVAMRFSMGHLFTMGPHGWSFSFNEGQMQRWFMPGTRMTGISEAARIVAWVYVGALAPVCWLATYFRLAEAEV
jgi:hypothetical protein